MSDLYSLIESVAQKKIDSLNLTKTAPCKVVKTFDNGNVEIELVVNGARYTVPNYSGSQLSLGETAQLFYRGIINSNTAYIGASIYKGVGGQINNCKMRARIGGLSDTYMWVAKSAITATHDTNVTVIYNSSLFGVTDGTADFVICVDGIEQDYKPVTSLTTGIYIHISFSVPVFLEQGEHVVEIHGVGTGSINAACGFVSGQYITNEIVYDDTIDSDYLYIVNKDTVDIISYIGKSSYPKVPSTIEGLPVNKIYPTAFSFSNVEAVYISDGITEIK